MPVRSEPTGPAATAALVLVAAVALAACTDGRGPSPGAAGQPEDGEATGEGVTVEAVGTVAGTPDVLTADVGVEVAADDVDTAYAEGNEAAAAVRDALMDAGVDRGDVQTAQLSLRPRRHRPDDDAGEYVARTSLRVTLRDLDTAGATLDAAVAAADGHATLGSLGFGLDDDSALAADAREDAFAQARTKAEQYAELAGQSLGELVAMAEADDPGRPIPAPAAALEADDSAAIEPGEEEVRVRVRATWALE